MKLSFGLLTLIAGICLPQQSCCLATASDPNIADVPDNENGWTEDTTPILVGGKIIDMMHSINGTSNVPNITPMIVGGVNASKGEFKVRTLGHHDYCVDLDNNMTKHQTLVYSSTDSHGLIVSLFLNSSLSG
jgi:hypothetical protein